MFAFILTPSIEANSDFFLNYLFCSPEAHSIPGISAEKMGLSGKCILLGSVLSQKKFEATDVRALLMS